jgi:hypothetical protein
MFRALRAVVLRMLDSSWDLGGLLVEELRKGKGSLQTLLVDALELLVSFPLNGVEVCCVMER